MKQRDFVDKLCSPKVLATETKNGKEIKRETYSCLKCETSIAVAAGSGPGNVYRHLVSCYGGDEQVIAAYRTRVTATGVQSVRETVSAKAMRVYEWLDLVVGMNLPFTAVENPILRKYVKINGTISIKTFMKYLGLTTMAVQDGIRAEIPDKFGLVFDGWSGEQNVHYIGIFAVWPDSEGNRVTRMLAMSPPLMEADQSAESITGFINATLEDINRDYQNVLFITADNTNVNPAIARQMGTNFVGCASHRFNLAMKDLLSPHYDVIKRVASLMSKIKAAPKVCNSLREKTGLLPVVYNKTRWSSTFAMLQRYLRMYAHIRDERQLLDHLLHPGEHATVEKMLRDWEPGEAPELAAIPPLKTMNQVCVALQKDDNSMNLLTVRKTFDNVLKMFPRNVMMTQPVLEKNRQTGKLQKTGTRLVSIYEVLEGRIGVDSDIVRDDWKHMENGLVKVMGGKELTDAERQAIEMFKKTADDDGDSDDDDPAPSLNFSPVVFAPQAPKRKIVSSNGYMPLDWIPPTSNVAERLFSRARLTLSDQRKSMSPVEAVLYLSLNRKLWTEQDIQRTAAGAQQVAEDDGWEDVLE